MSFEDGCKEMYEKVFSDTDPTTWLLFGYTGKKITPQHAGEGGLDELVANFEDNQVQYALLRLTKMDDGGDSKRTKFVFITWVGEDAPALKKGMVNMHKNTVGGLFVGFHIEKAIYERSELDSLSDELDSKVQTPLTSSHVPTRAAPDDRVIHCVRRCRCQQHKKPTAAVWNHIGARHRDAMM